MAPGRRQAQRRNVKVIAGRAQVCGKLCACRQTRVFPTTKNARLFIRLLTMHTLPRPAHHTKDQIILKYPFQSATFSLAQRADGVRNGTALWLGGQCLAFYLAQNQSKFIKNGARAIELGSGIGMTAYVTSFNT